MIFKTVKLHDWFFNRDACWTKYPFFVTSLLFDTMWSSHQDLTFYKECKVLILPLPTGDGQTNNFFICKFNFRFCKQLCIGEICRLMKLRYAKHIKRRIESCINTSVVTWLHTSLTPMTITSRSEHYQKCTSPTTAQTDRLRPLLIGNGDESWS